MFRSAANPHYDCPSSGADAEQQRVNQRHRIGRHFCRHPCPRSGTAASPLTAATQPNLRMYKSEAGFNAIMSWYEETEAKIPVPVESVFVDTRFGRTHMLVAGPVDAEPVLLIPGVAGCAPLWRHADC